MSSKLLRLRCLVLNNSVLKQSAKFLVPNQITRYKFPDINNITAAFCKYSTNSNSHNPASNVENIYTGSLTKQIRAVKAFSLTTSLMGIVGQPIIYTKSLEIGGTPVMIGACAVVGFFTFVTPILLHLMTKKYVIKLDYDNSDKTYNATILTFILLRREVKFRSEDVIVPDVPGIFTTFIAKKVPLFVDFKAFTKPEHISKIMGYDKPFDFKLYENDTNETSEKNKN